MDCARISTPLLSRVDYRITFQLVTVGMETGIERALVINCLVSNPPTHRVQIYLRTMKSAPFGHNRALICPKYNLASALEST